MPTRRTITCVLTTLLLTGASATAWGQENKAGEGGEGSETAPVESFLEALQKASPKRAVEVLEPYLMLDSSHIKELTRQVTDLIDQVGSQESFEQITSERAGRSGRLVRLYYLGYNHRRPVGWRFVLYRTTAGWKISELAFETESLFEFLGGKKD